MKKTLSPALSSVASGNSLPSDFGSDHDFNDCVFAVNPRLNIVPLPVDDDPEGLNYDHKYYSNHSLEDLLRYEWFVYDDFPKKE